MTAAPDERGRTPESFEGARARGTIHPDLVYDTTLSHVVVDVPDWAKCFLCGSPLGDDATDEHVIPKWLQGRYDLWNQRINLPNGTHMPYKQVRIPCCQPCNGERLSLLEQRVQQAFAAGPRATRELPPGDLLAWMTKVYYGLRVAHLNLVADRRAGSASPRLSSVPELAAVRGLRLALGSVRGAVRHQESPGSVFVFETQADPEDPWDLLDTYHWAFLAVRVGNVGVVASLLDGGALATGHPVPAFELASRTALHPLQFSQVAAVGALLVAHTHHHQPWTIYDDGGTTVLVPRRAIILEPYAMDHSTAARLYAEFLAAYLRKSPQEVVDVHDHTRGWDVLRDKKGRARFIPLTLHEVEAYTMPFCWATSAGSDTSLQGRRSR